MNSNGSLWLGYSRFGGRFGIKPDEMGKGMALLGHGSNDIGGPSQAGSLADWLPM